MTMPAAKTHEVARFRPGQGGPRSLLMEFLDSGCQDFVQLRGDRRSADDQAVIGGFCRISGRSVLVLGYPAAMGSPERSPAVPSVPTTAGACKVLRLMRLAEKFGRPIVTFYGFPTGHCATALQGWKQAEVLGRTFILQAGLQVPLVSVVQGVLTRDALLTFGVGDRLVLLMQRTGPGQSRDSTLNGRSPAGDRARLPAAAVPAPPEDGLGASSAVRWIPVCPGRRREERGRVIRYLATLMVSVLDDLQRRPSAERLAGREANIQLLQTGRLVRQEPISSVRLRV